jgi:Zn-dependent protease
LNILLAVFNLIPIPPLDGSKVASFGLPGDLGERYDRIVGPYGFVLLMVLVMTGVLRYVLEPIETVVFAIINGFVR